MLEVFLFHSLHEWILEIRYVKYYIDNYYVFAIYHVIYSNFNYNLFLLPFV